MTFRKTIQIPSSKIEECDSLMNVDELDYEKNDIPRFSTIERWTADYGNQYEIDLKVCSGSNGDPLWCEAVLFKNGCEVECSEVYYDLAGIWTLSDGDLYFELEVVAV